MAELTTALHTAGHEVVQWTDEPNMERTLYFISPSTERDREKPLTK
jgi:hypothetical protein